jgi:hypothetical protein
VAGTVRRVCGAGADRVASCRMRAHYARGSELLREDVTGRTDASVPLQYPPFQAPSRGEAMWGGGRNDLRVGRAGCPISEGRGREGASGRSRGSRLGKSGGVKWLLRAHVMVLVCWGGRIAGQQQVAPFVPSPNLSPCPPFSHPSLSEGPWGPARPAEPGASPAKCWDPVRPVSPAGEPTSRAPWANVVSEVPCRVVSALEFVGAGGGVMALDGKSCSSQRVWGRESEGARAGRGCRK